MDNEKILIFNLSNREFAIRVGEVDRILSNSNITLVPNEAFFIEGIIDYEEIILNVVNLNKLFSIEDYNEETINIIVVTMNGEKIALKVNDVSRIATLDGQGIELIPQIALNENSFLKGVINLEGKIIILLDIEKIINLNNK